MKNTILYVIDSGEEITENKAEDGQVRFSGAIQ